MDKMLDLGEASLAWLSALMETSRWWERLCLWQRKRVGSCSPGQTKERIATGLNEGHIRGFKILTLATYFCHQGPTS